MLLAIHPTATGICRAWHSASGTVNCPQSYCFCGHYKWAYFLCQHSESRGRLLVSPQICSSQFISWINLDFGINICFAPRLTGYIKTWLQCAFPVYIISIMAVIILCAKWSKFLQRIVDSQMLPVLATLALLSFTKLIHSVIQALHFKCVSCDYGVEVVWFVDSNIKYLEFSHSILSA